MERFKYNNKGSQATGFSNSLDHKSFGHYSNPEYTRLMQEGAMDDWHECANKDCQNLVPPIAEVDIGVGLQSFSSNEVCQQCSEAGVDNEGDESLPF